jgi:hypothetical protein
MAGNGKSWHNIPVTKMKKTSPKTRQCARCQGPTERRLVEHPYWHNSVLVALVQNVPASVCLLCNSHCFDPAVETTLGIIVKDYVKIGQLFPIPSTPYRDVLRS